MKLKRSSSLLMASVFIFGLIFCSVQAQSSAAEIEAAATTAAELTAKNALDMANAIAQKAREDAQKIINDATAAALLTEKNASELAIEA